MIELWLMRLNLREIPIVKVFGVLEGAAMTKDYNSACPITYS